MDAAVAELKRLAADAAAGPVLLRTLLDLGELEERRRNGAESAAALERVIGLAGADAVEAQKARYLLARTCFRRLPARQERVLPLLETLEAPGTEERIREVALQFRVGVLQELDRDSAAMALLAAEGARPGSGIRDWALDKLAWLRVGHNDWVAALKAYEDLLALPATGELRAGALFWAGRCQEALGHKDLAGRHYADAAAEFPLHWYGLMALARLAPAQRKALPKKPAPPLVHKFLAQRLPTGRTPKIEALVDQGLARLAGWELEAAQAQEPDNLRIQYRLARLKADQGEFEDSLILANRAFSAVRYAGPDRVPAEILKLLYPLAYAQELRRYAADSHVSPTLAAGLIHQESGFFASVVSSAGAVGLMQLMPGTASKMAAKLGLGADADERLTDPAVNLHLGMVHLGALLRTFHGQSVPAVASYNAGPNKVVRWWGTRGARDVALFVERIPYSETRDYVKKVLGKAEAYRQLYPELRGPAP